MNINYWYFLESGISIFKAISVQGNEDGVNTPNHMKMF